MFRVNEISFKSFIDAVRFANRRKSEVYEVLQDGSIIQRWAHAHKVSAK